MREHTNDQKGIETFYVDDVSIKQKGNHSIDLISLNEHNFQGIGHYLIFTRYPKLFANYSICQIRNAMEDIWHYDKNSSFQLKKGRGLIPDLIWLFFFFS